MASNTNKLKKCGNRYQNMFKIYICVLLKKFLFLCFYYIIISGTDEERGILKWRHQIHPDSTSESAEGKESQAESMYDIPYITPWLRRHRWTSYVPFLPTFKVKTTSLFQKCCRKKPSRETTADYTGRKGSDVTTGNLNKAALDELGTNL
jgi:hypothetical protein